MFDDERSETLCGFVFIGLVTGVHRPWSCMQLELKKLYAYHVVYAHMLFLGSLRACASFHGVWKKASWKQAGLDPGNCRAKQPKKSAIFSN